METSDSTFGLLNKLIMGLLGNLISKLSASDSCSGVDVDPTPSLIRVGSVLSQLPGAQLIGILMFCYR